METSILDTFRDGTVLITGSTGFIGKLLTEKLLRSCNLKNVAVLVRRKKGLSGEQRMADIYNQAVFDRLRKKKQNFLKYIKIINGNIEEPALCLSLADRDWLIQNVNFIFHCAATVKFNEPLELATKINVIGTENVLKLATEMKCLKGFVYVSTAYSHCIRHEIKEQFYPVPITAEQLKNLLDRHDPTLNIIENWPNTYTFTKAITENLLATNENHLPISIFRPSVVGCTNSKPYPGWFENMVGLPSIITGIIVGLIRAVLVDEDKVFDVVPADFTINALISVMWDTVNRCHKTDQINSKPKIFNYVSGVECPLTWARYIKGMYAHYYEAPPLQSVWYIFSINYYNLWVGKILRFWLHRVPAVLMDLISKVNSNKPKMMKMYSKTEYLMDLYQTFTTNEWKFDNNNIQELWLSISHDERKSFQFSLKEFDWNSYIKCNYYGIRKYILHEDSNNVAKSLDKNRKLFWLHIFCIIVILFMAFEIIYFFI